MGQLLWRLALTLQQSVRQLLVWSHWRRWYQTIVKHDHDK
jgi:hypothetical protein